MYVTVDQYREAWNRIKHESLSHSTCRIVVFVSCLDVDALCAAKIFVSIFQKDLIPHKIIPVIGYQSFKTAFSQLDSDITNVICIGFGANVDVEEYLGITEEESPVKVHIFDNHRPWNLNNLYAKNSIVCYDDGSFEDMEKYREAYVFLAEGHEDSSSSESEDDQLSPVDRNKFIDDDEDADDDNDEGGASTPNDESQAQVIEDTFAPPAGPTETQIDTEQAEGERTFTIADAPRKRTKTLRKNYLDLIEEYYTQGSYLNTSDALLIYTLLTTIGETSLRNLWLTIVGVVSLDNQYPEIFNALYPLLRDEIRRLRGDQEVKTAAGRGQNDISLNIETDYSLFLLRQWSLYESMIHSPYVSARLYLWTENGRKKLHKMLAQMGISLQEAKEQWNHMNPTLKRKLKVKLEKVSGMYGIEAIIHDGVVRRFGYKGSMSAADCSEAVAALLESGANLHSNGKTISDSGSRQFWIESFWAAWDSVENYDKLDRGIAKAKLQQQAVVSAGTAIFEKGQLKDLQTFRLAVVREGPDVVLFCNPLALTRLGVWLSEGCAHVHEQLRPLVVATFDESTQLYLVLGMSPRKAREDTAIDTTYNVFGQIFQQVATEIKARVRIDAFESAVIEVAKEDLSRFLETLALNMRTEKHGWA